VNTATITGESLPKARTADGEAAIGAAASDASNLLLAGTALVSGQGRAIVFATGMRTEFGKIAHLTQTAEKSVSHLQLEIARLSKLVAMCLPRAWAAILSRRNADRPAVLDQSDVRHRHHRRECAGRIIADGNLVAGHGHAAHGEKECPDPAPAGR
jgi:magnesium-transporting ATPase (P-type)